MFLYWSSWLVCSATEKNNKKSIILNSAQFHLIQIFCKWNKNAYFWYSSNLPGFHVFKNFKYILFLCEVMCMHFIQYQGVQFFLSFQTPQLIIWTQVSHQLLHLHVKADIFLNITDPQNLLNVKTLYNGTIRYKTVNVCKC